MFWRTSPTTWFIYIESKFDVNEIRDDKLKFNYVVANLDSDTANKIREIFNNPNKAKNKYCQIKTALINIFEKEPPENEDAEITGDNRRLSRIFQTICGNVEETDERQNRSTYERLTEGRGQSSTYNLST